MLDFPNQKHITTFLAADLESNTFSPAYVFVGGEREERLKLIKEFSNLIPRETFVCHSLLSTLVRNDCICLVSLDSFQGKLIDKPHFRVFSLRQVSKWNNSLFVDSLSILAKIARCDPDQYLPEAHRFILKYGYKDLVSSLIKLSTSLLLSKIGHPDHPRTEEFKLLFSVLTPNNLSEAIKELWNRFDVKVDGVTDTTLLCLSLASILNPSFDLKSSSEPIIQVETPLTYEEIGDLLKKIADEDEHGRETRSDTPGVPGL